MEPNTADPREIAELFWETSASRVAVACSAGPDSLAALSLLANATRRRNRTLVAFHIDHGWRGTAAAEADAAVVLSVASSLSLSMAYATSIPPAHGSPEMRARVGRYLALTELCIQFDIQEIVTAHHADDQIETRLVAILRQSRPSAFEGIRSSRALSKGIVLRRPFLHTTRDKLREFAPYEALHDPTNDDVRLTRNAIRHNIIAHIPDPTRLEAALSRLANVAKRIGEFAKDEASTHACARVIDEGLLQVDIASWSRLSPLARDAVLEHATSDDSTFPRWTPGRRELLDSAVGVRNLVASSGAPRKQRIIVEGPHAYFDVFEPIAAHLERTTDHEFIFSWGQRRVSVRWAGRGAPIHQVEIAPVRPGLRLESGERLIDAFRRTAVPRVWRARLPVVLSGGVAVTFAGMIPRKCEEPSATMKVIEGPAWPNWPGR